LEAFLERHVDALAGNARVPRRVAQRTAGLARELFASAAEPVLLHTDLHFRNVLAAERAPWLAIDPKPMAGPPGFELQPALRNRAEELGTGPAFRWSVRQRVAILADAMGIDEDEARAWSIVHSGLQVHWCSDDREDASFHLALMKALDD
jgi:streptomycin 6-kinase